MPDTKVRLKKPTFYAIVIVMSTENVEFSINQRVVYPSQGVGTLIDIFDKKVGDKVVKYYKFYIDVSEMNVMVPVANASMIGIRPIVSAEDAQKALDSLAEEIEPVTSDWKMRYQMNLDLLKKGSIEDIATIVRCLYHRSKVKELPILERKLYDNAKKLLEDEISFALGLPVKEVEAMLHAKLEPLGLMHEKKAVLHDEDDEDEDEFADNETDNDSDDDDDSDDSDESDASDNSDDDDDDE